MKPSIFREICNNKKFRFMYIAPPSGMPFSDSKEKLKGFTSDRLRGSMTMILFPSAQDLHEISSADGLLT